MKPRPIPLAAVVAVLLCGVSAAASTPPELRDVLLKSAVRIRYERGEGNAIITGHGTAFGVDLRQYGYAGRRCLLSAAHNVLDDSKKPYADLKVEIQEGTRSWWSQSTVLAYDGDLDICLVQAGDDLPCLLRLAPADASIGSPVLLAGSPRGVPVALFEGILTKRFERGSARSAAQVAFDHGDSGGPIVAVPSGEVLGVAVAGVPKDGDLDHNIGLFVPLAAVTAFLEEHRRGAPLDTPQIARVVPAVVAPASVPAEKILVAASAAKPVTAPAAPALLPESTPRPAQAPKVTLSAPEIVAIAPVNRAEIPVPAPQPKAAPALAAQFLPPPPPAQPAEQSSGTHVVQSGENLTRIARQYNVTLVQLVAVNKLSDVNRVLIGQKLVIPDSANSRN
ncbi:MAG TPA: LysM peptidoglycan-binding domain-containing protein [Planctomycetota bacterium]|jgi:LysM repeat protein